jgi:hypothetical protein
MLRSRTANKKEISKKQHKKYPAHTTNVALAEVTPRRVELYKHTLLMNISRHKLAKQSCPPHILEVGL